MTFGGQTDEGAASEILGVCEERGINFLDTANAYTGGKSEEILGRLLKGKRHNFVLASKVGVKLADSPDTQRLSAASITRAIEESLRRLATDHLDLYYLHLPDYTVPIEESLQAMDNLVQHGKVRYVACSNYGAWQVTEMLWLAEQHGYKPPWVTQPMYNLVARGIEQEYLPMCERFGVSTIVYNPLAGGLLTGKQSRGAPLPGTRFDNNRMYLDRYWHDAYFDAVEQLREIASRSGRSLLSLSLCWLYFHTRIDCMILGASRVDHLKQNLDALNDGPLDAATLQACDEVWAKLRGPTPKYNR